MRTIFTGSFLFALPMGNRCVVAVIYMPEYGISNPNKIKFCLKSHK